MLANLAVALVGGIVLLAYDVLSPRGAGGPVTNALALLVALYVAVVIVAGSALTYLWVELPTGAAGVRRRSGWAVLLGFFASLPIAYLSLVIIFQIVRPLLGQ